MGYIKFSDRTGTPVVWFRNEKQPAIYNNVLIEWSPDGPICNLSGTRPGLMRGWICEAFSLSFVISLCVYTACLNFSAMFFRQLFILDLDLFFQG